MYGLTAASFSASAYGMLVGKNQHEVVEVLFAIKNLSLPLHGFTIALISDIHSSINMLKEEMDEYVKIVNGLQCDLILVTGDFVNSMTEEVYPFAEAFSSLRAPHGVYGVMGNHDFFAPQPEVVAKEVDACGVKLLRNDKIIISRNGGGGANSPSDSFYLVGVDDVGRPERAAAMIRNSVGYAPLNIPKILMIHRPYFLEQAANENIDLVLSGHTHGGQIVFAQFGNVRIAPASLASRYVWGKYKIDNTQMYINRGIGTVGLPIRLNCPPEITKITLIPQATPTTRS
jgi:predicted MPP superfamily phosphohydrolase